MKSKLSIALLWAVIFVLGGVAGWFGNCIYRGTAVTTATTDQKARKSPKTKEDKDRELQQVIDDLTRNLQLDAAQQESLRNIFHETHLNYQELNQEFRPRYEMIRDESDDSIRKILHDDQRERFEELLKPFRPQKSAAKM